MTLIPVDPIMPETPQADLSCSRPNPGNTVPPGSEDEHSRIDDPQSFTTAIEEALRRTHVSGQDHVAPNEMTTPTSSPVEPSRQNTDFFLPSSTIAQRCGMDQAGSACSASTPEKACPQALSAFPASVPVQPAAAAQELAQTSPPQTSAGPTGSAAESPEPPAELFLLDTDQAGSACSASTPEKACPQALSAFPASVPVQPAAAAQELAQTSPPQTSAGPTGSAAESPEPPAELFLLDQGGESIARLAAPAVEDSVFRSLGIVHEAQESDPHAAFGPQAQAAKTTPSDPSLLPGDREGLFSFDAEGPRVSVPEGRAGASGTAPSPDRTLAVSFTMTSEPLLKDPKTGPQNPHYPAAATEVLAGEPNRPRSPEGSTPRVSAMTALPQEETATGPFPAVAADGETPGKPFETAPKAGHPAGHPSEPLAPEEESPALSDPQQGADDPFQDGPKADKTGAPRTVPSAAPSARSPSQERDRPVSQAGLAGVEEIEPLERAGAKPAQGHAEIPWGPGRGAPAPGPWRRDSLASHLQINAREAIESSAKQFHLRIQGDGLGTMRWEVHLGPGKIAAQALVDTIKLQELVQGQQDALVQKFQELGLEVEHFEVLVDSGSTGERFEGRHEPEPGGTVRLKFAQPSQDCTPRLASSGTGRGLDLFV